MRRLARIATLIEAISEWTGRFTAWLVLAMVLLITYDVSMRYLFHAGSVALQELEWHLFSVMFLIGAAYTLRHDDHVRVDMVYRRRRFTDRHRAWIDLIGTVLFLLPFCVAVIVSVWPFVYDAYVHSEGSPDPGGLPHRWLLKAAIPIGFGLLALQGIALLIRNLITLRSRH